MHEFFAVSQTSNLFFKPARKSTNERRFSLVPIEHAAQVPAEVGLEIFPYIASLVWRADRKFSVVANSRICIQGTFSPPESLS